MVHLYALLTAAVTPSTRVAPTVTTPTASPVIEAISGWEKADVIGSIALGLVALAISVFALIITLAQQRKEEAMRQREAKIAVMDKAFEIYNYFISEVQNYNYSDIKDYNTLDNLRKRGNEIRYLARMVFKHETYNKISNLLFLMSELFLTCYDSSHKVKLNIHEFEKQIRTFGVTISYDKAKLEDNSGRVAIVLTHATNEIEKVFEEYRLNL